MLKRRYCELNYKYYSAKHARNSFLLFSVRAFVRACLRRACMLTCVRVCTYFVEQQKESFCFPKLLLSLKKNVLFLNHASNFLSIQNNSIEKGSGMDKKFQLNFIVSSSVQTIKLMFFLIF